MTPWGVGRYDGPHVMIVVENLRFTYAASAAPAVRGLDFAVRPGEIFGFLGPSGAGKSTTQRILTGLLSGYTGRAAVLGKQIRDWKPSDYERIGVSFETPNHFLKLTALENLQYFSALYRGPTRAPASLLEAVGLQDDADKFVGHYSKGMRCRLGVARSLLPNPDLLFLDEPTAGLDPASAQRVRDVIRAERDRGATVFLTTHDMSAADALCDRVAFLVEGQISCTDSPRALKQRHGVRSVRVEYLDGAGVAHTDFPLDGLADNEAFRGVLRERDVQTLHTREATLSEIFIRVTGRRLE